MAYYAALASLQSTLEKFIGQDPLQILDDEDNKQGFDFLKRNVALLLDFLDNFPGSAPQLEKKIALSAEEAECMIEKYVWQNRYRREKVSFLNLSKLLLPVRLTAITIKSILRELEEIKTKAIAGDGFRSDEGEAPSHPESGIRKTTGEVLGFDDELARVKDLILYGDSEMVAIPIVGMGGVGKTTLARAAFDDYAVVRHFDVRRWVTVSQAYDSRAILLTILNKKSSDETPSLQDLSVEVHQLLFRRRFIIVVDDVWSLDAWDKVKIFFPDNSNRSRILLTTRDEAVASYANVSSTAIHHLGLMDEERSWGLFEQRLFGEGVCCPPELVELGKKIAQGCKGLPLAIVVVVGILSTIEQTPDSWIRIAGDVNMALSKGPGEYFSEILLLSYHRLPHFLKPCFLYFSAFPEDYDIDVKNVIRLWVAEGFLRAKPAKLAEEIAYGCLEDLTKRNLIMVSKKRYDGKITKCRIHDVLRELCIRQAEEQKFIYHNKDRIFSEGISKARRISITSLVSSRSMNPGQFSLHTTFFFEMDYGFIYRLTSMRWKLLRVLDMKTIFLTEFPPGLFWLYHLRYLAVSYRDIPRPYNGADICNLENLETFIVRYIGPLYVKVPLSFPRFWTMKNLRHAVISTVDLPDPRHGRFPLENLLTLSKLENFRCTEQAVELIPNLKNMSVFYWPQRKCLDYYLKDLDYYQKDLHYYQLNNFARFRNLESFTVGFNFNNRIFSNPFVGCLVLPSSLRRLTIVKCWNCILWEGISAAIGSLPNLESLKFQRVLWCGDVWETREGDFQNLRELQMEMVDLECWKTKSSNHFPNLERLVMRDCNNLAEVPDCIGDIATLRLIKADHCSEVIREWVQRIREEQREMGNEILEFEITG